MTRDQPHTQYTQVILKQVRGGDLNDVREDDEDSD